MGERLHLAFGDDGVATVTLDHPPLNIYDLVMRDELIEAVTAVRDVPSVRCMLLASAGRHFGAGADLSEFGSAESVMEARRIRWQSDPWLTLADLPVPTVAALRGHVLGSGFEMSLLCDIRLAADDAVLGLPETKLAMLPAAGGTQSLTRAIGPSAALPLVLTANTISAVEAHRLGIVAEVVPADQLDRRAREVAVRLAATPRRRWRALRACLSAAYDLPLNAGLAVEARQAELVGPAALSDRP